MSFGQAYSALPPTVNKEFLLLKIALESPAVLKGEQKKSPSSKFDEVASHNFIGLVTLFSALMYGNAFKYQSNDFEVPFDVVSMSQCLVEDELFLVVGVSENEKTQKQKSKRTKLGSYFFHTVSQFMNNNSLKSVLSHVIPAQQFHVETSESKLSTFTNIIPDGKALGKLLSSKESIIVEHHDVDEKAPPSTPTGSNNSTPCFTASTGTDEQQEMTCVLIENINLMPPKTVCAILRNICNQSLEIVGLKLGYIPFTGIRNPLCNTIFITQVSTANTSAPFVNAGTVD